MSRKIFGLICLLYAVLLLTAISWAQQRPKLYRVGFVGASSAATAGSWLEAFRQGLQDLGYSEGKNIATDIRWAEGSAERFPEIIAELSRLNVDVMVISGATGARAAKNARISIPVVFAAVTDPLGHGIIENLARPGGNITGTALAVGDRFAGKWVELLKETAPRTARMALLRNPTHPVAETFLREAQAAGQALGVGLDFFDVKDPSQLDRAFAKIEKQSAGALIVTPDPLFGTQRNRIVDFVTRHHLPSMFFYKEFVDIGGLMAYGPSFLESHRRAAFYVDKILKGAKPADLPVEQPTKFELVINLKTAKQIGLTIPPNVLARADKVIR